MTDLSGGKTYAVKLKLTKAGRRVLRSRRVLTITLIALARDASNNNGTAIKEANLKNLNSFIDNLLDGSGTPLRVVEVAQVKQAAFPGFWGSIFNPILASLGY